MAAHRKFLPRELRNKKEYGGYYWQCDEFDLELAIAESIAAATVEAQEEAAQSSILGQSNSTAAGDADEAPAEPPPVSDGRRVSDDTDGSAEDEGMPRGTKLTRTQKRARLRKRKLEAVDPNGREAAAIHIANSTPFICNKFNATHAIHSKTGYIGRRDGASDFTFLTGDHETQRRVLADRGYDFIDPPPHINIPILDSKGRAFCVKLSRDSDALQRTAELDNEYVPLYDAVGRQSRHRRGDFSSCKFGFSYGMGQQEPWNVTHSVRRVRRAVERFRNSKPVQRVFGYMEGGYRTWFPRVRSHCLEVQARIRANQTDKPRNPKTPDIDPKLRPPHEGSAFTACTCNLGPQTVCDSHRDPLDLAYGPSAMYISGDFDGSCGGQLILHEPRLVIHLYPGDIIFFPSACITHGNLPISDGETRRSLVLYMAGGLVRYDAQGLRTKAAWEAASSGPEEVQAHDEKGEERWENGWDLYSTMEELVGTQL